MGPQPFVVMTSDSQFSLALPANYSISYEYIDLWSSRTTWGGSIDNIPIEGDSVFIPSGNRVLLDVSPPQLVAIFLEGELIFDNEEVSMCR